MSMGKHFSEKQVRNVIEYFAEHRGQENAVTIEQVAEGEEPQATPRQSREVHAIRKAAQSQIGR